MVIDLKGKRALVGGSSQGIGRAIAVQPAKSGASVTLMARSGDKMKSLIKNLPTDKGQEHHYLKVDFTKYQAYESIIFRFFKENTVDIPKAQKPEVHWKKR